MSEPLLHRRHLDEEDALVGVSADVEGRVDIHETMLNGEAEMQSTRRDPGDAEIARTLYYHDAVRPAEPLETATRSG
jgi:hypothetical protein